MIERAFRAMLLGTAEALVRRLSSKVNNTHSASVKRVVSEENSYTINYKSASFHVHHAPPGNDVHVRIYVPQSVGARFIAHSQYFRHSAGPNNDAQFDKTILLEGEEEELTSRTLELVSLYLVRDAEK